MEGNKPPRPSMRVPNYAGAGDGRKMIIMAPEVSLVLDEVRGLQIAVLGVSGSGKSQTVRRFVEQINGHKVACSIIDIENEYCGLKEIGQFVLAGPQVDCGRIKIDIPLTGEASYYALARRAYRDNMSVVLLLQELDDDVRKIYLNAYLKGLFDEGRDPDTRKTHALVIEEAHEYCPQVGIDKKDALRVSLLRIAKRGRKRGIWPVVISQRPANIDKDFLTQSRIFLLHFVTYPNDVAIYKTLVSEHLTGEEAGTHLRHMVAGDVIFMNGRVMARSHVLPPRTESPSSTPGAIHVEQFKQIENLQEMNDDIAREAAEVPETEDSLETLPAKDLRHLREKLDDQASLVVQLTESSAADKRTISAQSKLLLGRASINCDCESLKARLEVAETLAAPARLLMNMMYNKGDFNVTI